MNDIDYNNLNISQIQNTPQVMEKFAWVKQKTEETAAILRTMELALESITIKYHERRKLEGLIQHQRSIGQSSSISGQRISEQDYNSFKERLEAELRQRFGMLMQQQHDFQNRVAQNLTELKLMHSQVLSMLLQWKSEEQLAGNGPPLDPTQIIKTDLNMIQSRCEELGELIWTNRIQLEGLERLRHQLSQNIRLNQSDDGMDTLNVLQKDVNELLSSLVKETFIVEKQPPQIIKKNSKFEATVRLLVGRTLNIHLTSPRVQVTIISEEEARILVNTGKCGKSGEILNNTATMKYQLDKRDLSVRFRNLQLERIKRSEKKEGFTVTEEKFCLVFQSQFMTGDIWTLSHPVVVTVHANQEAHSLATVTWDNAFGPPMRTPFEVPAGVPWSQLAETLNRKFNACTGRPLTSDNLSFLGCKIFGTSVEQIDPQRIVSWSRFCKKPLADRTFSFWDWFAGILKLTVENLKGPWADGSIIGFVGRQQAIQMLSSCQIGTFLLRFSEQSDVGALTISWIHSDQKVYSLEPQTSKNLATRSMADCINDISYLIYLYPDIPKENAFSRYFSPRQNPPNLRGPYVSRELKTFVPGMSNEQCIASNSNSIPQSDGSQSQSQVVASPIVQSSTSDWSPFPSSNFIMSSSPISPISPMTTIMPSTSETHQHVQQPFVQWTVDMLFNGDEQMDHELLPTDFDADANLDISDIMKFL